MESFESWVYDHISNYDKLSKEEQTEIKQVFNDCVQAEIEKERLSRELNQEELLQEANEKFDSCIFKLIDLEEKYGSKKAL